VAFDCGNLEPVALMVRRMHPNAKIIIAADNDCATPGNPGLTAARKAAIAVGGLVSVPVFPDGRPGDWNDWVTMEVRP
jgi:putative DNA primase/helicase